MNFHPRRRVLGKSLYWMALIAMICGFVFVDLFPRSGLPDFRYTGSDPDTGVLNLGYPIAQFIYDDRLPEPLIVGPLTSVLVTAQLLVLVVAVLAPALFKLCRKGDRCALELFGR